MIRKLRFAAGRGARQSGVMPDALLLFVAAVFALAGFVKGAIGLGLPTVGMGLLATAMPPVEAAAILILPSLATNLWQAGAGPALLPLVRRLWPMLVAACLGTWAAMGFMAGPHARHGAPLLGAALALYAVSGLAAWRFVVPPAREGALGPLFGAATGLVTALTGVFAIPVVPYLQGIGLEKEELVQALGLSFTVSTAALAVNVAAAGALQVAIAGPTLAALAAAGAGMALGQALRRRLSPALFRRLFFLGLLVLGVYLLARAAL